MRPGLEIVGLAGIPEVSEHDAIGQLIAWATVGAEIELTGFDVVVVAQKIVSKAEGRVRDLSRVIPGDRASALATELGKDPRLVELILSESSRIVRAERGVLIVETHHGWICANAGIDSSNVVGDDSVTLLPADPDASARRIRGEIGSASAAHPAVVVADSFGRPWRLGQADVAIGCAGLVPLDDWRRRRDAHGRELTSTSVAVADELAAAADLVRNKADGVPAVVIRGTERWVTDDDGPGAAALRRETAEDLFR